MEFLLARNIFAHNYSRLVFHGQYKPRKSCTISSVDHLSRGRNNLSTPDYEPIKLSNQLCFSLYSANNAVIRAYRPFLDKVDLTYSQFIVMMALWESNNISLKKLGQLTRLDSGTLTPVVKRLEKKDFLIRTRNKEDERLRVLSLTEKGWVTRDEAAKIPTLVKCQIGLAKSTLQETLENCEAITVQLLENS